MKKFNPKIEIITNSYQGYCNATEQWNILVVYNNILIEKVVCHSAVDYGRQSGRLEEKYWNKKFTESQINKLIKDKPKASYECDHCRKPWANISCVEKHFCKKCNEDGIIENYIEKYNEKVKKNREEMERRWKDEENERLKNIETYKTGFHWRDGWYFYRMEDKSVRITKISENGKYTDEKIIIPSNEWASIVCSVSKQNENYDRWMEMQKFHNE